MIPRPFRYDAPTSAEECMELLRAAPGEAAVLAGGTWVVPALADPRNAVVQIVDLRRAGLGTIEDRGDHVLLGATATYTHLLQSGVVHQRVPLLARVAAGVTGGPQIQNQGTIGGAACAARPSSDIPVALLALDAVAVVLGHQGTYTIPAGEFWRDALVTAMGPDEVLTGFLIPSQAGHISYRKLKFGTSSWPIVTVGAVANRDGSGDLVGLTVAVGGATAVPFRLPTGDLVAAPAEELLDEVVARAGEAVAEPWSDELAPAEYRAAVLPGIVRGVVAAALAPN